MCGGTRWWDDDYNQESGLSPRVRGNLKSQGAYMIQGRSIPACAGEPHRGLRKHSNLWVYPRVCGGTSVLTGSDDDEPGLSPRVRGNRGRLGLAFGFVGSIPACAGEPLLRRFPVRRLAVYPRVCGGTARAVRQRGRRLGLSPRVRGNRDVAGVVEGHKRSIPACAGEPLWQKDR